MLRILGTVGLVLALMATPLMADTIIEQKTDPMALSAQQMFQFDPQLVRIAPGETVTFRNSMSDHTVHAIPEIWPEDAEEVHISHEPSASFTFDHPGVYGITCARHGQYGMVMLILVDDPELNAPMSRIAETKLTPDAKKQLQALFDAAKQGQ